MLPGPACLFPCLDWGSSSNYFSKETFYSFVLSSSSGTPIMWILSCLELSHSSLSILLILDILFSLCYSALLFYGPLVSIALNVSFTCSTLLFIPYIAFWISVIHQLLVPLFEIISLFKSSLSLSVLSTDQWAYLWLLLWNVYQEDCWSSFHLAFFLVSYPLLLFGIYFSASSFCQVFCFFHCVR